VNNHRNLLNRVLLVLFVVLQCCVAFAANNEKFFGPEADKLHKKIAEKSISAINSFVAEFNEKSGSQVAIKDRFYDAKFHRLYIEIDGMIVVSQSLHKTILKGERIFSSNGQVAFDLGFKNPSLQQGKVTYELSGELIVFQESILSGIARVTPGVNLAYTPAGETILKFLDEARMRKLASITADALTTFSPEKLDSLKAELKQRADAMGDTNLEKIVFLTGKLGYFSRFLILALLKSIPEMIGSSVGGSLGSAIGSLLFPGPGTIVGAYIGSVISGQIVYSSQYRIPVNLKLARMKTLAKISDNGTQDSVAGRRFQAIRRKFNQEIRNDLNEHSYIVVDEVLKALKGLKKDRNPLAEVVAKDLQEILQFQLVHENDRYAARKLKQLESI